MPRVVRVVDVKTPDSGESAAQPPTVICAGAAARLTR